MSPGAAEPPGPVPGAPALPVGSGGRERLALGARGGWLEANTPPAAACGPPDCGPVVESRLILLPPGASTACGAVLADEGCAARAREARRPAAPLPSDMVDRRLERPVAREGLRLQGVQVLRATRKCWAPRPTCARAIGRCTGQESMQMFPVALVVVRGRGRGQASQMARCTVKKSSGVRRVDRCGVAPLCPLFLPVCGLSFCAPGAGSTARTSLAVAAISVSFVAWRARASAARLRAASMSRSMRASSCARNAIRFIMACMTQSNACKIGCV